MGVLDALSTGQLSLALVVVFLLYTYFHGHSIPTLSISLGLQRIRGSNNANDKLATKIELLKGNWGTIEFDSVTVCVYLLDQASETQRTLISKRQANVAYGPDFGGRTLYLCPKERAEFGSYCEIPSEGTYIVEAIVKGKRHFVGFSRPTMKKLSQVLSRLTPYEFFRPLYWMSSTVSLPCSTCDPSNPVISSD